MELNNSQPIQIKANRNGFILVPDPEIPFAIIMAFMEQRLRESQDFFQNSEMILDLRGRPLRTDQIVRLRDLLVSRASVKLVEVRLADDMSLLGDSPPSRVGIPPARQAPSTRQPPPHVVVHSTCRSGTRTESPGDCIVLGDVNPGAEVVAVGNVIIFGLLKGIAHAGAGGDRSAKIWALSIEPTQIRIGDLVAVPPRDEKPRPKRYEIAEIKNDMLQVSRY